MTPFQWTLVGAGSILGVAVTAFRCAVFGSGELKHCMRDQIVGFLESGVLVAFLVIAGWLGVEAAKASRRPWVGWCVGLSLAIAFTAFVLWLEIGPPRSGDESADDDDHYRR